MKTTVNTLGAAEAILMAERTGIELPASAAAAKVLTSCKARGGGKSDKSPIPNP